MGLFDSFFSKAQEPIAQPDMSGNFSAYDGSGYDWSELDKTNMQIYEDRTLGVYQFGRRNDWPDKLVDLFDSSPTHQAIINRTALMIAGDGFEKEVNSEELIDVVHTKMLMEHPNLKALAR